MKKVTKIIIIIVLYCSSQNIYRFHKNKRQNSLISIHNSKKKLHMHDICQMSILNCQCYFTKVKTSVFRSLCILFNKYYIICCKNKQ